MVVITQNAEDPIPGQTPIEESPEAGNLRRGSVIAKISRENEQVRSKRIGHVDRATQEVRRHPTQEVDIREVRNPIAVEHRVEAWYWNLDLDELQSLRLEHQSVD